MASPPTPFRVYFYGAKQCDLRPTSGDAYIGQLPDGTAVKVLVYAKEDSQ